MEYLFVYQQVFVYWGVQGALMKLPDKLVSKTLN